jgi:hypothetical protein
MPCQRAALRSSLSQREPASIPESRLFHGSLSGPRAPFSQASGGPKIARQVTLRVGVFKRHCSVENNGVIHGMFKVTVL